MIKNRLINEINEFQDAKNYWIKALAGELRECRLPEDVPEAPFDSSGEFLFKWDRELSEKIFSRCRENHLALFTLLLSVLSIVIARFCNAPEALVAAPVFNPGNRNFNRMIPLKIPVEPYLPFKRFLAKVKEVVESGYKNEHFPMTELPLEVGNPLSFAGVALALENIHDKDSALPCDELPDGAVVFVCRHTGATIEGKVRYPLQRFEEDTLSRVLACWRYVIGSVMEAPDESILSIDVMSPAERHMLLDTFCGASHEEASLERTVVEMFEAAALRSADAVAACSTIDMMNIYDELRPEQIPIEISFGQLNNRANRLASLLKRHGAGPGRIIALWLRHPLETVVAILGALKSGAAYLPMEAGYPEKLTGYILKDSATSIIVTEEALEGNLPQIPAATAVIMADDWGDQSDNSNPSPLPQPGDLAYVIYTSGTTGKPKGVLVEHRGIANYASWRLQAYEYCDEDVTLQLLPYTFDGFCSNFYSGLLCGGRLVMVPEDKRLDIAYIVHCIRELGVTNMSLLPGVYRLLLGGAGAGDLNSLRLVVLAGERSDGPLLEKSLEHVSKARIVNEYGPTEATVAVAANRDLSPTATAVIGGPIFNTSIYIMDEHRQLQPMKAPGELCVAGAGVSRGYLNQPELTAERFLDNPFVKGEKLYLSGDVGHYLPGGVIRLAGRLDHQVKIRGYRIETGAVQSALACCEGVDDSVVISWKDHDGDAFLVGYVVAAEGYSFEAFDPAIIKKQLASILPDYMIPTFLLPIDKIPRAANGKLDRRALPDPGQVMSVGTTAPRNRVEEILAEIWGEILGIAASAIGIDQSFFYIGGHSLKAAVLESMIKKRFQVILPLAKIFEMPSIRELASAIREQGVVINASAIEGDNLTLLRDGEGDNLFFIHDGSGDLEVYLPLSDLLKSSFRCWGIRAHRRDSLAPFVVNMEELALKYADIINETVPDGPLALAGYSAGGTIAFAVAYRLEALGRKITMLGLIEAPAPHIGEKPQPLTVESELAWISSFLPHFGGNVSLCSAHTVEELWSYVTGKLSLDGIGVRDIEALVPGSRNLRFPSSALTSTDSLLRYLNNGRSYVAARDSYIPAGMLDCPIVQFIAKNAGDDYKRQWERFARGGFRVEEVDGDHYSFLQPPSVEGLAQALASAMGK